MKYVFDERSKSKYQVGKYPIDYFQICWYDMYEGGRCYDEDVIMPNIFTSKFLTYLDTEDNKEDSIRTRIFAHHINGDIYEISLHKLTDKQWNECENFYGGK